MSKTPPKDLHAEAAARRDIDQQLDECGWIIQNSNAVNLNAGVGVAVREFTMDKEHGRAEYVLYVNNQAIGAIEAKPAGTTLTGVEPQTHKYLTGFPEELPA